MKTIIITMIIIIMINTMVMIFHFNSKPSRHDEEYDGCKEKDHSGKATDNHLSGMIIVMAMMTTIMVMIMMAMIMMLS